MGQVLDKCTYIAQLVAAENLKYVNQEAQPVCPKDTFYLKYTKRAIDLIVAILAFIILLPINLIIGVITFFDVGKPIFFKQQRMGKDGKPFYLIKFRNMTNAVDEFGNLLPASERVTRFGKFVRKYSLDELLNFYSIIKGDMSLIGPRPLPVEFEERYSQRHRMRTSVRPGLECPCINSNGNVRLYHEQFENDIWYVENASFLVDCKMAWMLVKMVFNTKVRGDHAVVRGGDFVGYNDEGRAFSMRHIPEKYEEAYAEYLESVRAGNRH